MSNFWQTAGNDPKVVDYAIGDGVTTWELYHAELKEIDKQELGTIRDLEDQLIWTLFRMERRGIKVDMVYLEDLLGHIEREVNNMRLHDFPLDFNERSGVQVKTLMTEAGRLDWPTTDKGNPSFVEKWLKTFPEGQKLVKLRKWTNLANSFARPLIETHAYGGRVHATINQLKTDYAGTAARLSCSNPNMQQVPKRDKDLARLFRKAFIPDDGFLFFEDDYSQCEPRLFAHYSGEPALIEGYNQTPFRDMHQVVADLLDVERDPTAKRMNMGIMTGMKAPTFAVHMDWAIELATEKHNAWFDAFPKIRDFQNNATRALRSREYVKTLLGRRGHLDNPRFAYKSVSKIIQGTNADILKKKMLEIDLFLESEDDTAHLFMTVHDAFEGQIPKGPEGKIIHDTLIKIMEDVQSPPFNLRVPFVVDAGSGDNWAEASFGPEKE